MERERGDGWRGRYRYQSRVNECVCVLDKDLERDREQCIRRVKGINLKRKKKAFKVSFKVCFAFPRMIPWLHKACVMSPVGGRATINIQPAYKSEESP